MESVEKQEKRWWRRPLLINDHELLFLKYLFETDFLTRSQIKKYIYTDYACDSVDRKLSRMTREGYIKKVRAPIGRLNETVLLATKKALDTIEIHEERLKEIKVRKNSKLYGENIRFYLPQEVLDLKNYGHDLVLNTVRFQLENIGADYWMTSKILARKKTFKFVPDGVFQKNGKVFAVEYETKYKSTDRYRDIFWKYNDESRINYVIYLTGNDYVHKSLARIINPEFCSYSMDAYKKFYLVRQSEFFNGNYTVMNPANPDLNFDLREVLS